jgi:hypothetical protein
MKSIIKFIMKGAFMMKSIRTRYTAALTAFIMVLVILCSSIFIIEHSGHNCKGNDCTICIELAQCRSNLNMLGTAAAAIALAAILIVITAEVITSARTVSVGSTLITLKVELLN